jgi:hypothetical protein
MSMPPPGPSAGETPASVPHPAVHPGPGQAPAAKKSRVPRLLVIVAVGVVALLAAGIGAFLMGRDYRTYQVVQGCGPYNCIPALKADTVIEALKREGHTCEQESGDIWYCDMMVGSVHFKSQVGVSEGYIYRLSAEVFHADDERLTDGGMAYMSWFATLPYRDDPATTEEIKDWLAEQIDARKDTKATILDYKYTLLIEKSKFSLDIRSPR